MNKAVNAAAKEIWLAGDDWTRQEIADRIQQAIDEAVKPWKTALEGLTPSGSEFVNDPANCARYVRDRFDSSHRMLIEKVKRIRELEAEVERLKREKDELEAQAGRMREALAFATCVIKSGEPWTDTCESVIGSIFDTPAPLDEIGTIKIQRLAKKVADAPKPVLDSAWAERLAKDVAGASEKPRDAKETQK